MPTLLDKNALFDRNLACKYLEAYDLFKDHGDLRHWEDPLTTIEAAKTLRALGAPRYADSIILRKYRAHRKTAELALAATQSHINRRGFWAGWKLLQSISIDSVEDPKTLLNYHTQRARLLIKLRDYEDAQVELSNAEAHGLSRKQKLLIQAEIAQANDEPIKAREFLEVAQAIDPDSPTAAIRLAEICYQERKLNDAIALYAKVDAQCEDRTISYRHIRLLIENDDYTKAEERLPRLHTLSPLAEKRVLANFAGLESEIYFYQGKHAKAVSSAKKSYQAYYKIWSENVEKAAPNAGRRILDVPFIKQEHLTCVPASIAAVTEYLGSPIDQTEIARELTYNGTRDSTERAWLERRGWTVREFSLTWDIARQLIDRDLPFTLTTRDLYASHMQAVMGYDAVQGIYYIREPGSPEKIEWLAKESHQRYQTNGLSCMLLIPPGEIDRACDIQLPEEQSYNEFFQFHQALLEHDTSKAQTYLAKLRATVESPRLQTLAQLQLAVYNEDTEARLASINAILELYPDDPYYIHQKAICLRNLGQEESCRDLLRATIQKAPKNSPAPYQLHLLLAERLVPDFRHRGEIRRLLRHVQIVTSYNSHGYWILAQLYTNLEDHDYGQQAARFAATLSYYDEYYAEVYFQKARRNGQHEAGLNYLQLRTEKLGQKSGISWTTYAQALEDLCLHHKAFEVIESGLRKNPEDEDLLTKAIETFYKNGLSERANELLDQSRTVLKETIWLEQKAQIDASEGDLETALQGWQRILENNRTNSKAIQRIGHLTECLHGSEAKRSFFKQQSQQQPLNYATYVDYLVTLREFPQKHSTALKIALEHYPDRPWLLRESAICAKKIGDYPAAITFIRSAQAIEPHLAINFEFHAEIAKEDGNLADATKYYRKALTIDIDRSSSIEGLLDCCHSLSERIEVSQFVVEQIREQVNFGEGIRSFGKELHRLLPLNETLETTEELLRIRPDLWQVWYISIELYLQIDQPQKALELSAQAIERFPYVGEIYYQSHLCYEQLHQPDEALCALKTTIERNPHYSYAIRTYAEKLWQLQQKPEAYEILKREIRKHPLDDANYGMIASLYSRDGDFANAEINLKHALQLCPAYRWARDELLRIAQRSARPEHIIDWARELVAKKNDDENAQICLVEFLNAIKGSEEALAACQQARQTTAHYDLIDWEAFLLAKLGRFDEAIASTEVSGLTYSQKMTLSIRRAHIEKERGNIKKAIELYRAHGQQDHNDFRAWSAVASLYQKEAHYHEAALAAKEMIRINPLNPTGYWHLAYSQRHRGEFESARSYLRTNLQHAIDDEDNINLLIDSCENQAHYEDCLRFLEDEIIRQVNRGSAILIFAERAPRLISGDTLLAKLSKIQAARPDLWQSWSALVQEQQRQNLLEQQLSSIEQALVLHPHIPRLHQMAAEVYEAHDRIDDAIVELRKAIQLAPKYAYARRQLINNLLKRQQPEEALQQAQKLVDEAPKEAPNHGYLAIVHFKCNNEDEGLKSLFCAIQEDPEYHWARNELVQHYAKKQQQHELIQWFREDAEQSPKCPERAINLAYVYGRSQLWVDALNSIHAALELKPSHIAARDLKGYYLCHLARYDEAIACCEYETANFEEHSQLQMRIGLIHRESGNDQLAIKTFQEILDKDELNIRAAANLTQSLDEAKDNSQEYYKAAEHWSRIEPNNAIAFGHLGAACLDTQRKDEAKVAFKTAYLLDPDYHYAVAHYFNNCLHGGESEEVDKIIERIKTLNGSTDYAYYAILKHTNDSAYDLAWKALIEQIGDPKNEKIGDSCKHLRKYRSGNWFEKKMRNFLTENDLDIKELGEHWAQASLQSTGALRTLYRLRKFPKTNKASAAAHRELLEYLGDNNLSVLTRWTIRRNADYYQNHTTLYGMVTYALGRLKLYGATLRWVHDWPKRDSLELWFLTNIAHAMISKRKYEQLRKLLDHCYTVIPDHTYERQLVYICLFEPRTEIVQRYASQLHRIDNQTIGPAQQQYLAFAKMRVLANGLDGQEADPKMARKQWRQSLFKLFTTFDDLKHGIRWSLFHVRSRIKNDDAYFRNTTNQN
ncbi:MAG: tetratricopeptide repeat protein [Opitutaceae bacterium]